MVVGGDVGGDFGDGVGGGHSLFCLMVLHGAGGWCNVESSGCTEGIEVRH